MDIKEHKKAFDEIINRYQLQDQNKAQEIAEFLTKHSQDSISAEAFAKQFSMDKEDAKTFLSFIEKGIAFKEQHIDHNR